MFFLHELNIETVVVSTIDDGGLDTAGSHVHHEVLGVAFWKSWLNYIDVAVSIISVAPW